MNGVTVAQKPFDFSRLEEPISIAEHNPSWLVWYEEEAAALSLKLDSLSPRFEHVGSSAVSGLKSKPIVDIMMGLEDLELPATAQKAIESLGYEYFGRLHADQARLFARKRGARCFNLQVVPLGAREWKEKIAFRDYLRAHPAEVELYSRVKEEAVQAGRTQLLDYHRHKDQCVTAILVRALSWSAKPGSLNIGA